MYPRGLDLAYRSEYANRFKSGALGDGKTERFIAKIRDQPSREIVSYISGTFFRGPLGIIDGDDGKPPRSVKLPMIEDPKDREFYEWYWTTLRLECRRNVKELQVPNVYIQSLCTHPAWQRHGAATMLMEWIVGLAVKEEGIGRCSSLASPVALNGGFYEKFGFGTVYTKRMVDEKRFLGREGQLMTVMIKEV